MTSVTSTTTVSRPYTSADVMKDAGCTVFVYSLRQYIGELKAVGLNDNKNGQLPSVHVEVNFSEK